MSRALLGILVSGHGHRFECGHCFNGNGLEYMSYTRGLTRWPGFLLRDCCWPFLSPGLLSWMPIRSRHCCEEPGRVLVWIVIATTVTKVVEGCVYFRRRFYANFGMLSGGEFEHSVLRCPLSSLSSNTTTTNKLIRPRCGQGIRAWTLRTGFTRRDAQVPGLCVYPVATAIVVG